MAAADDERGRPWAPAGAVTTVRGVGASPGLVVAPAWRLRPDDGRGLPAHPVVLVADDLTPGDTVLLDPARVVGFATARGGRTGHTAIVARALGVPAVVRVGPALHDCPDGVPAVLDGDAGTLRWGLDEADLAAARSAAGAASASAGGGGDDGPTVTLDGHRVVVRANVHDAAGAAEAVRRGAEGVGLLRTELLHAAGDRPPGEDEQLDALTGVLDALGGRPLAVRTFDVGGDKQLGHLGLPTDGVRGLRAALAQPERFEEQLRAIHRASARGPVSILLPMVEGVADLDAALVHVERARAAVGAAPLDVGIMVEVPSAVEHVDELARRVSSISIGTNDLAHHALAADPVAAGERDADALHPVVLGLVRRVVGAGAAAGIPVSVCGDGAGEPLGARLLAGLGVRELSVAVPALAPVRAALRRTTLAAAGERATAALACTTAAEVRALRE